MRISHAPEGSQRHRGDLPAPMIMRPISEYKSPIDNRLITSRGERNEDCKRNDAIPWEPGIGTKAGAKDRTPGKYKNPRFAKKRNLPLHESVKDK
jgi:hypothetical protein